MHTVLPVSPFSFTIALRPPVLVLSATQATEMSAWKIESAGVLSTMAAEMQYDQWDREGGEVGDRGAPQTGVGLRGVV